ncbi:hypothetical protein RB614_37800 [Phytohabitans sp. ZYX-F-186]|uniref:Bacteriophage tail tape measure N-terminal domain-containing protein n=1 Tax=Phytohabitans maris TaxID=3071409 RepID=A0ABU0ZTC0_9ACTN|nr:hypothetical protein [Phytohabitans sp. ZYX-F-186]MDQ7910264.1 hypothetical protein [Phytohabitans sp. ZYX-F-186]
MDNEVQIKVTSKDDSAAGFKSAEEKGRTFGDRLKAILTRTGQDGAKALNPLQDQIKSWTTRVEESQGVVDSLRKKIAETGDTKLFGDLSKAEAELGRISKFRDSLVKQLKDAGDDGGRGFALSFVGRAGPLIARAPLNPYLVAAIGSAAPAVTATLVTALTTGAALGAVGIGAAVSADNPKVAAGLESLQRVAGVGLTKATEPFVPAMLGAIERAKAGFRTIQPELEAIFGRASTYLDPLADGLIGLGQNALPGIRRLVDAAEPLVDIFGEELPEYGQDLADLLSAIADSAERNENEWHAVLDTIGLVINQVQVAINLMDFLSSGPTRMFIDLLYEANEQIEGARWVEPVEETSEAFATAADAARSFREEMQKLIDDQLNVEQATINWQQAIDDVTASIKENGKSLDAGTEKGRANRQILLDLARAGLDYADAIYQDKAALGDIEGAEQAAEKAYQESRRALVAAAAQMLGSKAAAEEYVTEILGIPPTRNTRAEFTGDNEDVRNWKRTLSGIPREIFTSARLRAIVDIDVRREQATEATGRFMGGITGSAQSGGARAGLTLVGEYGREVVDLPPGAHVYSNPDTERLLAGGGSMGGWSGGVLEVRPAPGADTAVMNEIIKSLKFTIRTQGQGDSQKFWEGN